MIVASILNTKGRDVLSVQPEMTVREAATYLCERHIGAAVVLDKAGALIGIFSERDVLHAIADEGADAVKLTVRDLMTADVHTCAIDDTIDSVMATMTGRRVRHLPVMGENGVIGVISIGDVVKSRIAEAETEAQALKAYIASG